MSEKNPTGPSEHTENFHHSPSTSPHVSESPTKPTDLDEIAGREWDRLVTERQGRPRTMSLHHETLLLTAAAQAYRYGWAVGNLARQLGISAPDLLRTVDKDLSASYASLCGALGCSVANPLLRDS